MSVDSAGRFVRNLRWLTLSNILYRLVSIGVAVYIARDLGSDVLGRYAAVTNLLTLLLSFADLGITNVVIRGVSRDPARAQDVLDTFFLVQLASGVLCAALAAAIGAVSGWTPETQAALLVGAAGLVASGLAGVYNALLSARERLYPFAVIEVVCMGVFVLGNALVVAMGWGLVPLVAVTTAVSLVKLALGASWAARHGIVVRGGPVRALLPGLLAAGAPFLVINGGIIAGQRLDVLFITWVQGDAAAGTYAAASRLVFASLFLFSAVGASLFPVFSRLLVEDRGRAAALYIRASEVLVALACAAAVLLMASAPLITRVLYGDGWDESAIVLATLAIYLPAYAGRLLSSNVLMTGDMAWRAAWAGAAGLAALILSMWPLLLLLGAPGAALAVCIGEVTASGITIRLADRFLGHDSARSTVLRRAVMLLVAAIVIHMRVPDPFGGVIAVAVMLAGYPLLGVLTPASLRAVLADLRGARVPASPVAASGDAHA